MKKIILILLSFVIYFNSITANASPLDTPMRGWNITGGIAQGASTLYQATKNALINGKNVQKTSSVLVAPVPAKVIKVLVEGGAFLALSVAVDQLLGAVDWVMDPANNQITYKEVAAPVCPISDPSKCDPTLSNLWSHETITTMHSTIESACKALAARHNQVYKSFNTGFAYNEQWAECLMEGDSWGLTHPRNPVYDPVAEKDKTKTLSLEAVAQQVISNADAGDIAAQAVTSAVTDQILEEAKTDSAKAAPLVTQLEAAAVTPTSETATGTATQTNTKTDPATGETTTETKATDLELVIPKACEWAPSFCEAAAATIAFPITAAKWWETSTKAISDAWVEAKDWASSENKNEEKDTEVELIDEALPDVNTNIFGASGECPPDFTYPFPLPAGGTYTISYSYATVCTWFSKLYYVVVSVAWIIAFRIVTNTNSGNSDG